MENVWLLAALWMAVALLASLISVRIGISAALVEIFIGVLEGNFLHFQTNDWINFLAGFGSILLAFLAGAEIDPVSLRKHLRPSLAIGTVGFFFPYYCLWEEWSVTLLLHLSQRNRKMWRGEYILMAIRNTRSETA